MSRAATPDAPTAIASEARRRRARVVARGSLDLLRSPAARRFGFELERGRLRPAGLSAPARWLTLLGLATLGFLCVAVLVPGVAVLGPASFVRAIGLGLVVHTGTVGTTVLVLGIGWELLVYGASRAAPSIRVATGVLFLFSNGLLIANLTITPSAGWAAVLFSDVAKTCLVAVTVVLVVGAFVREGPAGRRRDATSILRLAPCLLTAVMSGALLVLEGAGQGPAGVRGDLAAGTVQSFATIILLFAPLLYLSGMAVLSLSYTIGAAATASRETRGRGLFGVVLTGLFLAEAWFYGWRDRRDLWPAPPRLGHPPARRPGCRGLRRARLLRPAHPRQEKRARPRHRQHGRRAPRRGAELRRRSYFALYSISTLGFFHVPAAVRNGLADSQAAVVSVFVSTGPRCVLLGVTTVVALVVARESSISIRRRQSALCLAFMSFWVFWTLFVDWLPGTDTADESLLSLTVVVAAAVWVAARWHEITEQDLARAVGLLIVVWLLDADTGLLRSLAHLRDDREPVRARRRRAARPGGQVPVEREHEPAAAVGLAGDDVDRLSRPLDERRLVGSQRQRFAQLTAHNAELGVFAFIALPVCGLARDLRTFQDAAVRAGRGHRAARYPTLGGGR